MDQRGRVPPRRPSVARAGEPGTAPGGDLLWQATGARLHPVGAVPPPSGKVVLVVTGGTTNVDHGAVDVPAREARYLPPLLATRMDARGSSVANYGPTRFVHPTEGYRLEPATYDPRWVWQLRSIEVE